MRFAFYIVFGQRRLWTVLLISRRTKLMMLREFLICIVDGANAHILRKSKHGLEMTAYKGSSR